MQYVPAKMPRQNLASDLADQLRELIISGQIAHGRRINEVHLARQLAVSRTPLREALTRLAGEGFIRVEARRGFFVPPLSADEVRDLYPLRAVLDPSALELAGLPSAETLAKLQKLNRELAAVRNNPARLINLDKTWHRMLIADCPNRALLEIIDRLIQRTSRYEYAYLSKQSGQKTAVAEHEAVLEALRQRKLKLAVKALKQNLSSAAEPLIAWLQERDRDADWNAEST